MRTLNHDGVRFAYRDTGTGPVVVLQHGLGGDAAQPASQAPPACRLITLECRGHGRTPLGVEAALTFDTFARDLDALLDELRISSAVVGGISMGAGVALALARRSPRRVRALVLVRPAWTDRADPPNLRVFGEIAAALRRHGPAEGRRRFVSESATYRDLSRLSPSLGASLTAQFDRPDARERAAVLERLTADRPIAPWDWQRLPMPALVVATRGDAIHPFDAAATLHRRLPAASLREVPSKDAGDAVHRRAIAEAIEEFVGGSRALTELAG